jgi:hypothetical protein
VYGLLRGLADAYARFDESAVEFDEVAAMIRRGVEAHTFAPRRGDSNSRRGRRARSSASSTVYSLRDSLMASGPTVETQYFLFARRPAISAGRPTPIAWTTRERPLPICSRCLRYLLARPSPEQDAIVGPSTLATRYRGVRSAMAASRMPRAVRRH